MPPWHEEELIARGITASSSDKRSRFVLVLDGVQDPHNLGACLRTADACGALAVVIPKDRAVQMNATVRKVAAGAAETTPLAVGDQSRAHAAAAQGGGTVDRGRGRRSARSSRTRRT